MHTVLIVDDQPIFREIIRSMLEAAGGFTVVAEAADGSQAVDIFRSSAPDLVMMDVQMPQMNGFQAAERMVLADPQAAIILTSMRRDPEYARMASEAGAMAFFPKRDLDMSQVQSLLETHVQERQRKAA